jgi:hypothetical protein
MNNIKHMFYSQLRPITEVQSLVMLLHKQQVTIPKITPDITVTKFRNLIIPNGLTPINY